MALTRKMLAAMDIDAEKISQIIEAHAETVAGLKDEIDKAKADIEKYKAEAGNLETTQKELADLKEKVAAEAKEREGKDYDALKKEYDDYKADQERKAVAAKKESALRDLMKDLKISEEGVKQVLKWQGVDSVELDENGKFTNSKEIRKGLEADWGKYIEHTETVGAQTQTPPDNNGGQKMTREEILSIKDKNERQAAISANHELFGY